MLNEDRIRISHMRDAAAALSFVAEKSRNDLGDDRQLLLALVKSVEIMGEAAAKVSRQLKSSSPDISWRDIVAMRNRLIHAYFDVDLEILWQTITSELPPLLTSLEKMLSSES